PSAGDPQLVRWALPAGRDPVTEPLAPSAGAGVAYDRDGAVVTLPGAATLAIDPGGRHAVITDGTEVRLVGTGAEASEPPVAAWTAASAVAAVDGDSAAVVADGVLHL